MLLELIVENYAVVEQARIRFQEGLNILTGETGSGKSLVVDSLGLLLGARASAEMIRTGESRARIAGIFSIHRTAEVRAMLNEAGVDFASDEELIIEREIAANGKSRAFVSNRPATTAYLRQLAPALGDIHGQNEQQRLFSTQAQRELLDEYARSEGQLTQVAEAFAEWRELQQRLAELTQNEQEKLRLLDLWTFQRNEIDGVKPAPGEDAILEQEKKVLQNVTRLQENASAAFDLLYEGQDSATTQLRQAMKRLDDLTRIDQSLSDTAASLKQAVVVIDEAAFAVRDYLGRLEGDPSRLEDVESRLAALDRLKRKYGGTIDEVLAFREDVARKADEVENAAEHRIALEKQIESARERYVKLASELTDMRTEAATKLSKQVESELKSLAMAGTRFQIDVRSGPPTAAGVDEIAFVVAPNRGEELRSLERIASGGELSRIALALKTAAGTGNQQGTMHTLVFDEIDAGIGGAAAAAVGRRLKTLSRTNQVICVTHLAQIAGFADHHYAVSKREKKGRVTTQVEELKRDERAREIGRMLSGEHVTAEALRHAEQLIQAGRGS
ncbi:MAG: DNA repair protein RecN [Acidobacteriaceae bacterium]|nr:DNA repair protein RecN [Acidobacteriaceae bacterium]